MTRSARILKWLGLGVGVVVAAILCIGATTIVGAGIFYKQKASASGLGISIYLPMHDGVRIAVDVALPKDLKLGQKIPALIKGTPYWRGTQLSFLGGAAVELGLIDNRGEPDVPLLNHRGYAIITVDTRGTGASFGHQDIMFGDAEVQDFGEIIDWTARQEWSNGRVGAYGFSYRGILATDMALLGRPALKAIAPSFDFPDLYLTAYPGGVLSKRFIEAWSTQTAALNHGVLPCPFPCSLLFAGPKPVDSDTGGALLAQAIAEHSSNYDVFDCVRKAPNRDDKICASGKSLSDVSEMSRKGSVESAAVPLHVVVGWFDANSPQQAFARYRTFSNPQELLIGSLSHGGFQNTDPFAAKSATADPPYGKQISDMADFFDAYLKADGKPFSKSIRYYVLNGGGWRRSDTWPPHDAKAANLYLASDRMLSASAPASDGNDSYKVDFTASTGIASRYQSPVDLSKTSYFDRAAQDQKLLTYTGVPLVEDVEIAGDPVARLALASTSTDGVVIVYLEQVTPSGGVIYLTEGALRIVHRKIAAEILPALSSDPLHTYLATDSSPMTPGKAETIEIALAPIAARLHKGDRIRIAIAGADADNLQRIPATGDATFTIERSVNAPSWIELPEVAAR